MSFFAFFVLFQFFEHFSDFFASIFSPKSKFSWQKIYFSSFHFLVFFSHVSCPFFSPHVLSRRSDGRRQNTSPREMSEANGENGQQNLKRRSFVGVFFSMTEGLSWWTWINHGECHGWWFLARFGNNSVSCDWVTCVWHRQTAGHPQVNAYHHLPLFFLSLSLHSYSPHVYPPSSTRGKKLLETLGNLRRWSWTSRIQWSVSKIKRRSCKKHQNLGKDNSTVSKRKQTNWQIVSPRLSSSTKSTWATTIQGSYFFCTWPGRRISPTILKGRICQITARDLDAPLQRFGMEIDSLKEDEEWVEKRWWSVGLMEEHGSRNVHEKKLNENNGRDETVVWWVELVILHMVLLMYRKKTVVVPQIQYIAVCDATTCSLNSECSETLEDDLQNAVQRWSGQCPCSDAVAFSHQKRWNLSPSENFVKNLIACVVKMVLCGRTYRSMSSHLHYLLFSFTFFL